MSIRSFSDGDLIKFIEENLPVKKTEKEKFGEVFTPVYIINKMLDLLPSEVWSNMNLTWLDPANGIGNFPIIIYLRLMKGLKDIIKDENERKNHIIKNMLFMIEFNPKNIEISKRIFGKEANIYCGSFVDFLDNDGEGTKKEIKSVKIIKNGREINSFDIIIGNPPYNKGGTRTGNAFWPIFVHQAFRKLNSDGYLCFIHPLGWKKPFIEGDPSNVAGRIWFDYKKYWLRELVISDEKIPNFPNVDYYCWQKIETDKPTKVSCKFKGFEYNETINLNTNFNFLPNLLNKLTINILEKVLGTYKNSIEVKYNPTIKLEKGKTYTKTGMPHLHWFNIDKNEYDLIYSTPRSDFDYYNKKKVVLTYNAGKKPGILYPKYIFDIIAGTTNNTMYILVENDREGINIEKFMDTDLVRFLMYITQYSEIPFHKNEFKILNYLKLPNFDELPENYTENDLNKFYNLSSDEIDFISEILGDRAKGDIDKSVVSSESSTTTGGSNISILNSNNKLFSYNLSKLFQYYKHNKYPIEKSIEILEKISNKKTPTNTIINPLTGNLELINSQQINKLKKLGFIILN